MPVIGAGQVADGEGDGAAVRGEFHGIAQNVHQHLPDAHGIGQDEAFLRLLQVGAEGDIPVGQEAAGDARHGVRHLPDVHGQRGEADLAAFDAADVQHVVDKGQQMLGAFADLFQAVPDCRLGLLLQGDVGKADDGVHGGADVVGHIVEEGGFCPVGVLGGVYRVRQLLIDPLVPGAVGQIQDDFLLPLDLGAEYHHPEPQLRAGSAVDILPIPLPLLAGLNSRDLLQDMNGVLGADQLLEGVDVPQHLPLRQAHQLLNVGADVLHPQIPGIHHQEHIVHVDGQGGEQLIPGQQLGILSLQLQPVPLDHVQHRNDRQSDSDAAHHQQGGGLELVHAGVDHARGHDAQHDPVLEIRGLIDQVIVPALQGKFQIAGSALHEVQPQSLQLLVGEAAGFLQKGEDVAHAAHILAAVVHHHPAVGQYGEGAGPAAEGGDLQSLHHVGVVVGDGDGLVAEALEAALPGGDGEYHDLRPIRHHGVCHHIPVVPDQLRQLPAQIQVALLPLRGAVFAVPGDEIEIGEMGFLPGPLHKGDDLGIAFGGFQEGNPHPHLAPADGYQIVQRLIGLMEDFRQVGGAFFVDRVGYKAEKG